MLSRPQNIIAAAAPIPAARRPVETQRNIIVVTGLIRVAQLAAEVRAAITAAVDLMSDVARHAEKKFQRP